MYKDDVASVTKHFLAVSALASGPTVSELNRIASASMLGSIAGMFEPEAAETLIEPEARVKSFAENRRDGTAEQKRLKDVSMALSAEHPKLAFRPPHFEVVDHGIEIKILTYE